jgi:hypothetical protein
VIIGEERHKSLDDKIWSRKVALKMEADGKETLKIILKAFELGGKPTTQSEIEGLFIRRHGTDQSDW